MNRNFLCVIFLCISVFSNAQEKWDLKKCVDYALVIPKCAGIQPEDFDPANPEHRFIRLYVGMEDPQYLIADLNQALNAV